jgi:hypothetical protein
MGDWRKSTYSDANGGNCVEVADDAGTVLVRDTTDRDGAGITVGAAAWRRFTGTIKLTTGSAIVLAGR